MFGPNTPCPRPTTAKHRSRYAGNIALAKLRDTNNSCLRRSDSLKTPQKRSQHDSHRLRPVTAAPSVDRARAYDDCAVGREKALQRVFDARKREKERTNAEQVAEKQKREERQKEMQDRVKEKENRRSVIYAINRAMKKEFDKQYEQFMNSDNFEEGVPTFPAAV